MSSSKKIKNKYGGDPPPPQESPESQDAPDKEVPPSKKPSIVSNFFKNPFGNQTKNKEIYMNL